AQYRSRISTLRNGNFSHSVITSGRYRSFEIDIRRRSLGYFGHTTEKRLILASAINGEEIPQICSWRSKRRRSCKRFVGPGRKSYKGICLTRSPCTLELEGNNLAAPFQKKTRRRVEGEGTRSLNCRTARVFRFCW